MKTLFNNKEISSEYKVRCLRLVAEDNEYGGWTQAYSERHQKSAINLILKIRGIAAKEGLQQIICNITVRESIRIYAAQAIKALERHFKVEDNPPQETPETLLIGERIVTIGGSN